MSEIDVTKLYEYFDTSNPREVAIAQQYLNMAHAKGYPMEKIDSAFRWAKQNAARMNGDMARAERSFKAFMSAEGWKDEHISEIVAWRNDVADGRVADIPAEPTPDKQVGADLAPDAAARLAEIRDLSRYEPEKYNNDEAVQAEHRALLAGGAPARPDRLAEIRTLRRNDPDQYERGGAALRAEELALIEASLPKPPVAKPEHRASLAAMQTAIREVSRNDPDRYNSDPVMRANQLKLITATMPAAGDAPAAPSAGASNAVD